MLEQVNPICVGGYHWDHEVFCMGCMKEIVQEYPTNIMKACLLASGIDAIFAASMESLKSNPQFIDLVSYFPPVDLPFTVQYNDLHRFTRTNDPLPDALLQTFIFPHLDFDIDEFTEFLPCLRIHADGPFVLLVLWTGRLMHYAFTLWVFEPSGRCISQAEIAGFYSDQNDVYQRMAHVNEESEIFVVETNLSNDESKIELGQTKKWMLSIQENGAIHRMEL